MQLREYLQIAAINSLNIIQYGQDTALSNRYE